MRDPLAHPSTKAKAPLPCCVIQRMGGKAWWPNGSLFLMTSCVSLLTCGNTAHCQTWSLANAPYTNWTSVAISADGSMLLAGTFGRSSFGSSRQGELYTSTNTGVTWSADRSLDVSWQSLVSNTDGTKMAAAGWRPGDFIHYGTIAVSTDGGFSWADTGATSGSEGGLWMGVAASADGSKLIAANYHGYIFTSTNSGVTWGHSLFANTVWTSVASSADGTRLVAVNEGLICTSTNSGATWTFADLTNYAAGWTSVASSADGSKLVAASGEYEPGLIYRSIDSGVTWTATGLPSDYWVSVAASADGAKLIAAASGGPVYTSSDSGTTWISNSVPRTNWVAVASSADGSRLVAATGGKQRCCGAMGNIYVSQVPSLPVLTFTASNDSAVIAWVVPSSPFVLQQNSDLTIPNWIEVTNTPALNLTNLHYQVVVPISVSNLFYRLRQL